jgi:hypothetical protein
MEKHLILYRSQKIHIIILFFLVSDINKILDFNDNREMFYEFQKIVNNTGSIDDRKCKNENNLSGKKYNYN